MVTPDVPEAIKQMLTSTLLFHRIQQVSNIRAHISLFKKDWFRDVFTKLHIFNMTEYDKVIFLDLDIIVHHADIMDSLFDLPCMYGAMENSKGKKASSNWLKHGQRMDRYCGLINAGVIIVTPHADLFQIFLEDVTFESQEHEPGMTPEQCYLARVMGRHFVHISQLYNFEVQFHGGVPVTPIWTSAKDQDIVCFHFSGASPLRMLGIEYNVETGALSLRKSGHTPTEWGCQTDKFFVGKSWDENFDPIVRSFANQRAEYAFNLWETNLRYGLSRCAHITKPRRICPVLDS
jgi:lipopolysaccharide biosynthesis glycosyltransferase